MSMDKGKKMAKQNVLWGYLCSDKSCHWYLLVFFLRIKRIKNAKIKTEEGKKKKQTETHKHTYHTHIKYTYTWMETRKRSFLRYVPELCVGCLARYFCVAINICLACIR